MKYPIIITNNGEIVNTNSKAYKFIQWANAQAAIKFDPHLQQDYNKLILQQYNQSKHLAKVSFLK